MKVITLKNKYQFDHVFSSNKSKRNSFCTVYFTSNPFDYNRFGFIIRKSCGNSPERNRIRRRVREILRILSLNSKTHFDYVFICNRKLLSIDYKKLKIFLESLEISSFM